MKGLVLALQEQGVQLGCRSGALTISKAGKIIRRVRPHEIIEVHLFGRIELTSAARALLLKEGIDALIFTAKGQYRGRLMSFESPRAARRMAQYRHLMDSNRVLDLARRVVVGKLRNQRSVLMRFRRRPGGQDDEVLTGAITALRRLSVRVEEASAIDEVMGFEGQGAHMYYRGFARVLSNPHFDFPKRTRRPPRDPVNACLSFGYTFLLARARTAVYRTGLDPFLGALHSPGRGKPSLVLDLMEEFRPAVVDRLVLTLLNRHQLTPEDFEEPDVDLGRIGDPIPEEASGVVSPTESPPVHMGPSGRVIFLRALYSTWRRQEPYPPRGVAMSLGDIINAQAIQMAHLFEGKLDHYTPFLVSQ